MPSVYPGAIPTTTDLPDIGPNLGTAPHDTLHDNLRDTLIALCAELGVSPSAGFATLRNRLDAGWQPIDDGSFSAASSFDVSIPASTYDQVELTVRLVCSTQSGFVVRVNNDTTADLHAGAFVVLQSDAVSTTSQTGTGWTVGTVDTPLATLVFNIFDASFSSSLPFESRMSNYAASEAGTFFRLAGGRLAANRTLSSLRLFPAAGTITGRYVARGYVTP